MEVKEMNEYVLYFLNDSIYTLIDAVAFGLGIAILIRIVSLLTPLKFEKVKENRTAEIILWAIIFILFGAFTISGYFINE
jgi:prolipoprotein diacylglyceryltransferase